MKLITAIKKIFFTATAVYLSDDFIDIAQADITMNGVQISRVERFPLEKKTDHLPVDGASDRIDRALDVFFPDEDDNPYRIAVNIPNEALILRRFSMGNIPKKEMARAIAFEAQKYIPFTMDSLAYGFKTLRGKGSSHDVVFAAAESKQIDRTMSHFTQRNIIPSVIEPAPILLARLLNLQKNEKKTGAYMYIHYEPVNKIMLCEITGGYPYFIREITIPKGEMALEAGGEVYPTLKKVWPFIEKQVSVGIDYMKKETAENVEKIFISGFDFSPGEETVSSEFGIPIERPRISFFKGAAIEKEDRYVPVLMLLHDLVDKPFLNVAPEEVIRRDLWGVKSVVAKSAIIFLAILFTHALFVSANFRNEKKIKNEISRSRIFADLSPLSSSEEVLLHKNTVIEKSAFINDLVVKKDCLSEKLAQLEKIMPPESWVKSLDYINSRSGTGAGEFLMVIRGSMLGEGSADASSANKILEIIKQNKIIMRGFKEAELASVEKKEFFKNVITEFRINLK